MPHLFIYLFKFAGTYFHLPKFILICQYYFHLCALIFNCVNPWYSEESLLLWESFWISSFCDNHFETHLFEYLLFLRILLNFFLFMIICDNLIFKFSLKQASAWILSSKTNLLFSKTNNQVISPVQNFLKSTFETTFMIYQCFCQWIEINWSKFYFSPWFSNLTFSVIWYLKPFSSFKISLSKTLILNLPTSYCLIGPFFSTTSGWDLTFLKAAIIKDYKMINLDSIKNENKKKHNEKWSYIPDHPYRILIIGGSRSEKNKHIA